MKKDIEKALLLLSQGNYTKLANKSISKVISSIKSSSSTAWQLSCMINKMRAAPFGDRQPFNIEWVQPNKITRVTGKIKKSQHLGGHYDVFNSFENKLDNFGTTSHGDWDQNCDDFTDLLIYKGLEQRFIQKKGWRETKFYKVHKNRIKETGASLDCQNIMDLDSHCRRREEMYYDIKNNGYKSQEQLGGKIYKEVVVNIGRNGEYLFNGGGRHRLSIAKILNLDIIPVIVLKYHEDYVVG